uniref:PDZ domain-containing protein n=1 Tax=Ditylum brightwellii TaxID=49249 RepID=A0A6V2HT11_9STRA
MMPLKDFLTSKSRSESDEDVPHRLQLQRRVSSRDTKKAEADAPMRSQLQRRVYSLGSKNMAIRERNSSFSRPSIPATARQKVQSKPELSDPGDLSELFARAKSIQKNMSFEDFFNYVSMSESGSDVAVRSQLQRISSPTSPFKSSQREFDFYAPRGLLGIVIESSPRGPMVQSISRTSPLLGIINRGDYIIGLDGMNTKGMTAAQLTLFMTQRSEQPQRKISFLSCGGATKC